MTTTYGAAMLGAADDEPLAFDHGRGHMLLTQDNDVLRLHASGAERAGIAHARQGTPVGTIMRGLALVSELYAPDERQNRVEFL